MHRYRNHPLLLAVLFVLVLPAAARCADFGSPALFARFFGEKLHHPYALVRIDGIVGLGRLGTVKAVSQLTEIAEKASGFERLVALWALARIGTPDALAETGRQVERERSRLLEGSFYELAARTAFLAGLNPDESGLRLLDRALPKLYTEARKGNLEERLLAAWALYEIGTPVTAVTADETMATVANELDPEHGNFTRQLLFIRLVGPPATKFMAPKLKNLLRSYPFKPGLAPKRALTAFTLAFITAPEEPPTVRAFREKLARDLGKPLRDFEALENIRALGPFACTPGMVEKLRQKVGEETDEEERKLAGENLRRCDGG